MKRYEASCRAELETELFATSRILMSWQKEEKPMSTTNNPIDGLTGKYGTILINPPWRSKNRTGKMASGAQAATPLPDNDVRGDRGPANR